MRNVNNRVLGKCTVRFEYYTLKSQSIYMTRNKH